MHNHLIVLEEDRTYLVDESILDLYDSHAQHGLQKEHNRLKVLVEDTLFWEGSYIPPSGAVQGGWLGSTRLTSLGVGKTCSEGACTPLLGDADLYWLVGRNSHHRDLVEGSFCLEASGIRRYYDAPLLPAWVRSSCLQEKEASKTCQVVACTLFSPPSHASWEQSSHSQVLGEDKIYSEVSFVVVVVVVSSRHQGWVGGRTSWEASCIGCHCDAFLEHDSVEYTHQWGLEDRIDLEVAYTGPQPFLEGGSLLLEDSYTHSIEEEDNLCFVEPYTHSSRGALVDCSCPTSGVEDSSW